MRYSCSSVTYILMSLTIVLGACNNRESECVQRIRLIHAGATRLEAESQVQRCGFKMSYDEKTKTLFCDKTVHGLIVSKRTQISIKLDDKNLVTSVKITDSLIGP